MISTTHERTSEEIVDCSIMDLKHLDLCIIGWTHKSCRSKKVTSETTGQLGDIEIDIPCIPHDDEYYKYKEGVDLRTYFFSGSMAERRVFKSPNTEKPHRERNDIELSL